jgi:aryl-alcohol dehydrogenase-like predicted oxidoreductase
LRAPTTTEPGNRQSRPVSSLGLGCSQIGSIGHPASPRQWRALIDRALALGVTALDTADIYGQGDSEREIGRVLRGRRDAAFVVTKIGKGFSPVMAALRPFKPVLKPLLAGAGARAAVRGRREGVMRSDFSPAHLVRALDASLRRLGLDAVDALLLHGPVAEVYRDPGVVDALTGFVKQGKARRVGASCENLDDLAAALAMPGLGALQLPLDLYDQADHAGLVDGLGQRNVLVMLREVIRSQPTLEPVAAVAAALSRRGVDTVVVGTGNPEHLEAIVRGADRSMPG